MTTNETREKILEDMCTLGKMYLDDGKLDNAFRWLKAAADLGNDHANCELGDMHYLGHGVEKNIAKAVEYYKVAADLGNNDACLSLFKMYRDGESNIKPNIEKAVDYLAEIALDGGYVTTAENFYAEGCTYPLLDGRSVLDYYGDDNARFELGCMYLYGDYVERDIFKAACWFANMNSYVSEIENFFDALFDLAECYRTGDGIKKDMNRAVAWYEHIINYCDFHDKALFTLADIYFNGDDVKRDIAGAVELYKRAADNGNLKAAYTLEKIILEQNHQRLA